jgi:nucleotide-binding universal stress UspA family protein
LHPTDFSECAAKAEAMAVDLASKLDGEIILLQVLLETPLYGEGLLNTPTVQRVYDAQRKWSEEALDARANDLRQRGIKASRRGPDRHGHAWPSRAQPPPARQRRRAGGPSGHLSCADGAADEGR